MTVITKPLSENKAKKLKEPLCPEESADGNPKLDIEAGVEPRFVILGARAQRVSTATTVCLFLTALLVMSIGVIGGMYLYRQFARSQMHFHGWCTIPYNVHPSQSRQDSLISDADYENLGYGKNSELKLEPEAVDLRNSFKQEFEIDLESESFEKIIPNFGRGRRVLFIHDFGTNKTGIVDLKEHRCFVMPLNRQRVLLPRTMYDLVEKILRGMYEVDTEVVRETMKVVTPAITDFNGIGPHIAQECRFFKTYLLEKDDSNGISKRSVPTSESVFAEFAGNKILELFIDTGALDAYEKETPQV